MTTRDPFSDEAVEARRRLRTLRQNLGPFATGLLEENPEGFAQFAEETADLLGQTAGFQGASIANPETFASFIGQSAQQFEQTTGQPSPLRGTEGRRVVRREGEGLGVNPEAIAFGVETALFGPGRALAGNPANQFGIGQQPKILGLTTNTGQAANVASQLGLG